MLRHEKEIAAHQSFNYALLNEEETAILGCVYIDPPERTGSDEEVSWWVVDGLVGGELERALDVLVPQWIAADWPFQQPVILAATLLGRTGSRCRAHRDTSKAVCGQEDGQTYGNARNAPMSRLQPDGVAWCSEGCTN
ncbi:hypothetical protein BX264_5446 [Streptomyces sp. 2333.5]|nr:hypothetical protein BX264_5446 [Streptomyces sp. 2333.5]SEE65515.1 hypothetical protein SAMN05428943_5534 [Streptomyces sp. 2314.4]SEE92248.1 hypothetical protein SAMN05428942_5545 [Streptomyces sp. 2112.2]